MESNLTSTKVSSQIVWIDVRKLHPNSYNPNVMNKEKFEALCDFLKTHKAEEVDPIWVRHDGASRFEIIDGEHRWKAAKEVGWKRLRAFVLPIAEDEGKAFNVRKNRERGQLDPFKLGEIFLREFEKGLSSSEISRKYGYTDYKGMHGSMVCFLIDIAKHKQEIKEIAKSTGVDNLTFSRARQILLELKHPKSTGELDSEEPSGSKQTIERFLSDYKEALKRMPKDAPKEDDIKIAIDFFKKLLSQKNVSCPICGEQHLQWRCGHDF